jgi:hypothetical protein
MWLVLPATRSLVQNPPEGVAAAALNEEARQL